MCNDQLSGIAALPSLSAMPADATIPSMMLGLSPGYDLQTQVANNMSQLMQEVFNIGQGSGANSLSPVSNMPNLAAPLSTPQDMMAALQSMYSGSGGSLSVPSNAGYPNPYGANGPFASVGSGLAAGSLDSVGGGPLGAGNGSGNGGGWTATDSQNINSIMGAGAGTFSAQDVQSTFGQTYEGNCASVAVIKAAMEQYGNKMFAGVQSDGGGGFNVTLQNGQQVNVTQQDLATTAHMAQLHGNGGAAQSMATLAFAVEAKNAAAQGYDGQHTLQGALQDLDKAAYVQAPAQLLGLGQDLESIPLSQVNGQNGVIGVSSDHAINIGVGANGQEIADHYGSATAYNGTDTRGGHLQGAFELKPLNGALPVGAAPAGPAPNAGGAMPAMASAPATAAPVATPASPASGFVGAAAPSAGSGGAADSTATDSTATDSGSDSPNNSNDWNDVLSSDAAAAANDLQSLQSTGQSDGSLDQLQNDIAAAQSENGSVSDDIMSQVNDVTAAAASFS